MKDFSQISSGLALYIHCNRKERQVRLSHSPGQMIERYFLVQSEGDLISQHPEFCSDWIGHFTSDETESDAKRVTSAKSTDDDVKCIGQLLSEAGDASTTR